MTRYERFSNFIRILAIFGAIFLVDVLLKKYEALKIPPLLAKILRGISAVVVLQLAEFFTLWLFESCSFVRRIALGDDFLEGLWFDTVTGSELFGLLSISYKDGHLRLNGEQYDSLGNVTASWDNFLISLEGRTLRTIYRSPHYKDGTPSELLGFSTYIFSGHPGKVPERYTGYFADSSSPGARCALRGYRITDKDIIKQLRSPSTRQSVLLSLYNLYRTVPENSGTVVASR